jgi:hypothetical protein
MYQVEISLLPIWVLSRSSLVLMTPLCKPASGWVRSIRSIANVASS